MMTLPPLYAITDASLSVALSEQVRRFGEAGFPLVQFRGKPLDARTQWAELRITLQACAAAGGWPQVCLNDRADLAILAARGGLDLWGLHLGQEDLPPRETRRLPGLAGLHLGTSTHTPEEWAHVDPACDHAGVGPVRATPSKGDHAEPIGMEGLAAGCAALRGQGLAPVAIGGLGPDDLDDGFRAGAESLAMIGALQRAEAADLLWAAQAARWRVRPPLAPGHGVVLAGGSGSGKSSLGEALAEQLGMPFLDVDAEIVRTTGLPIPALFAERGEAGFRELEEATVAAALGRPAVVALGAGAWARPRVREAVAQSGLRALWLAEVPSRAWARVGGDPDRPLAQDREGFLARWRDRLPAWSGLPVVLPLGRSPLSLARTLAGL
jgi:thiamine-phosphate diphosphorylase